MTEVTAGQLETLRKRPHKTQLRMAIYMPDVLFGARVNNPSAAMGDITIIYDGVYTGAYTDVKVGMTLYYFVYDGPLIDGEPFVGRDGAVGRLRVRSITSSQVIVAENSIPWTDNQWIRIVRFVEPWPVFPRMVLDGSNIPTWYKDYDVAYTDQNDTLDPIVVMGPNRATTLTGPFPGPDHCIGVGAFYFDGSASYDLNPGGTITAYEWNFYRAGEATVTYSIALAGAFSDGWVGFGAAGNYAVSLTVTNNSGKSSTGWRFVVINNALDATCVGADRLKPIRYWASNNLSGNYQSGGWEGKIWFREPVGLETIVDGALVIIYAADKWGDVTADYTNRIGGNYPYTGDIVFSGYVRDGSVELSSDGSSVVTVGLTGLAGKLSSMEGYGVSVESVADPGADVSVIPAWAQIKEATVDIAIYHYIRWHTTIYSITDVERNGDTLQLKYADFEKGPLYQSIDGFLLTTVLAHACFDAQGKLWMEKKLDIVPVADRAPGTIMQLTNSDWRDKLSVVQRVENDTSYVEVGGFYYSGPATDISTPFIASAPSHVPGYEGRQVSLNGLVLNDQDDTNQLVGDIYANLNKLYPSVTVPMSGNYRVFDIAPQERLLITVAQGDTNLEIAWAAKSFIPRQITYNINNPSMVLLTDVVCEEETDGEAGVSGPYPPVDPCADGGCEPPPCPCADPDCNCEPPPCTDCGVGEGDGNLNYTVTESFIGRSRNYLSASPTWSNITTNLASLGVGTMAIRDFCLDPYDPINRAYVLAEFSTSGCLLIGTEDLNESSPGWVDTGVLLPPYSTKIQMTILREHYMAIMASDTKHLGGADQNLNTRLILVEDVTALSPVYNTHNIATFNGGTHSDGDLIFQGMSVSQHIGNPMVYAVGSSANFQVFPTNRRCILEADGIAAPQFVAVAPQGKYCSADLHVPYDNNASDLIMWGQAYVPAGAGDVSPKLSFSSDGGITWTDRNPGGYTTSRGYAINTATNNKNIVYCFRNNTAPASGGLRAASLYWSNVEGTAWATRQVDLNDPRCLGLWPDAFGLRVFFCEQHRPVYSSDAGVTLQDKTGNWAAVMGSAFSSPVQTIPVWVAV